MLASCANREWIRVVQPCPQPHTTGAHSLPTQEHRDLSSGDICMRGASQHPSVHTRTKTPIPVLKSHAGCVNCLSLSTESGVTEKGTVEVKKPRLCRQSNVSGEGIEAAPSPPR